MFTRSSFCTTGNCVEVDYSKSSYCTEGACLEAGTNIQSVYVRDSKKPETVLTFTNREWNDFLEGVKLGDFEV